MIWLSTVYYSLAEIEDGVHAHRTIATGTERRHFPRDETRNL